jgi:hypothetical protein
MEVPCYLHQAALKLRALGSYPIANMSVPVASTRSLPELDSAACRGAGGPGAGAHHAADSRHSEELPGDEPE